MLAGLLQIAVLSAALPSADWSQHGRPLPAPEPVVTEVQTGLPPYHACLAVSAASASGSVTAILPDLFDRWRAAYAKVQPSIRLEAAAPYGAPQAKLSPTLNSFIAGKLDFALVSRRLTPDDRTEYFRRHGQQPITIPVAGGSWRHFGFIDTVAVIVNSQNPLRSLSLVQLQNLLGGKTRLDWAALGVSKWAGRPVHIYGAADWLNDETARSAVVREKVMGGMRWRSELAESGGEGDAPGKVSADPLGIAVTGLGHLPQNTRVLALSLRRGSLGIGPSYRNVRLDRYPLSRTADLLLHPSVDGRPTPLMADVARFILSREGQGVVARERVFLPLTADQVRAARALVGSCAVIRNLPAH